MVCMKRMSAIRLAYQRYYCDILRYPARLSDLWSPPENEIDKVKWLGPYMSSDANSFKDPWGNFFLVRYKSSKPYGVIIVSYGPDGIRNDDAHGDDVVSFLRYDNDIFNYPGHLSTQIPLLPPDALDVFVDNRFPMYQTQSFQIGNETTEIECKFILYFFNEPGMKKFQESERKYLSELNNQLQSYNLFNKRSLEDFSLNYLLLEKINTMIFEKRDRIAGLWFANFKILDSEK